MKLLEIQNTESTGSDDNVFVAPVNPSSFKVGHQVKYNGDGEDGGEEAQGQTVTNLKYKGKPPQTISFELILDNTGVFENSSNSVDDQIENFKTSCYYYQGDKHEPPKVNIRWKGKNLMSYKGTAYEARIKSFTINYLLFSKDGDPLRAKINASFLGSMDPGTESETKGDNSPDLTHIITVKAGDTLPALCEKIYGKRQMFHEVAKANNLLSFRYIEPGTDLFFPPIK
jgi:LysM repeat protein